MLKFDFYRNLSEKPEYSVSADQKNHGVGRNAGRKYQYDKYNLSIDLSTCFPIVTGSLDLEFHYFSLHQEIYYFSIILLLIFLRLGISGFDLASLCIA